MIYSLSHATQVLAALVYLHIMGIFHRDKSFINIILTIIITIITIIINKTNNNKNRYWRRWYTFTVLSCRLMTRKPHYLVILNHQELHSSFCFGRDRRA
jgi:multisubunit Na+/H+ antiporter MnhE subunit